MQTQRWKPILVLALASHALNASAQPTPAQPEDKVQSVLAAIDAILGPTGAKRAEPEKLKKEGLGRPLCGRDPDREPYAVNRDFFCNSTTVVGSWTLKNLRADGGARKNAELEIRRFTSAEAARAAKVTALERYGGRTGLYNGYSIGWCFLDLFWSEDLLFTLYYTCSISLKHVKALNAVRSELLKAATPFENTGIVGVGGNHLLDEKGEIKGDLAAEVRFRHFFKVSGVAANDVLWLRDMPQSEEMPAKVDKIPPDATCIPLVFTPPNERSIELNEHVQGWVVVRFNGKEAWARRRYLADQPAEECLPHP